MVGGWLVNLNLDNVFKETRFLGYHSPKKPKTKWVSQNFKIYNLSLPAIWTFLSFVFVVLQFLFDHYIFNLEILQQRLPFMISTK